ncbi:MAG: SH3-like domain-containing protein, partial [Hyphomicrobiales bacterium]
IRGKVGIIERICGEFPNQEEIALCQDNPSIIPLYRCRFKQTDVWRNYEGSDKDTLELEIYEHWLKKI